jgi:RNA polymerase sigma factor (TIGR02999 family)
MGAMPPKQRGDITEMLNQGADDTPADELWSAVYPELRRRASAMFRRERADHTLSATAVVNETYVRLARQTAREWNDRTHFYNVASGIMRQVLIDHARGKMAAKRGSRPVKETLDESVFPAVGYDEEGFLAAEQALEQLASRNERAAMVVTLRVFGGLSVEETAQELGVSPRTVKADWMVARVRLQELLAD